MSERKELIEQMAELAQIRDLCAQHAMKIQHVYPGLADKLDAAWNVASDEFGRAHNRLHEIDAPTSRREHLADAAYGRML